MVDKLSGQVELIEVSSRRGRAATIAIGTITTGAAGTNASVTNVGTSGEAVFNFTIPMGDTVELRISGGYLQWKNTTAATWTNILEIADITATIDIGTVTTGDPNTDVLVTNSGAGKDAVFNFTIPRGDSVELRIDGGYIQWKTTTATTWNNLHAVSAITPTITVGTVTTGNAGTNVAVTNSGIGKDGIFNFTIPRGDDVQLRIDSGYLQWKNTTSSTWTNIVQITDITATIEVGTVTTGAAGTSVTFVNAGSGKDAIFNLSIPKGTTFTPSVSAEGVISFTNDGGLDNPTSVNIKGDKGDPGNLTGPASAVDENIPIFDGIAGDKLKDSGVKLSDKADVDDVTNALALKADVTAVTAGLLLKADLTYVEYLMMEGDPA